MDGILNFLRTDIFLIVMGCSLIVLLLLYIINIVKLCNLRKNYKNFMNKIGNGNNIQETIDNRIGKI